MASNSITLRSSVGGSFTLSVDASGGSGRASATATLTAGSGSFAQYGNAVLTITLDGESNDISVTALSAGESRSVSISVNATGSVTATASWSPGNSSPIYAPKAASVSTSVNAGQSYSSGSIRVGKSTVNINEKQSITLTNGTNNSFTGLSWSFNGRSGSLSPASQQWDLMNIEPYTINGTQYTITLTASQSHGGNISTSFTVVIPDTFKPMLKKSFIERLNTSNNNLIAGQSNLKAYFEQGATPDGNSASITKIEVSGKYDPQDVGPISFTVDKTNGTVTTPVFPNYAAKPKYQLAFVITATDTRGRTTTLEYNANDFGYIFCYIPPQIALNNLYRCDRNGNLQTGGQYAYIELSIISDSVVKTQNVIFINNVSYDIQNLYDDVYVAVVGDGQLLIGNQYPLSIAIINQTMINYGDSPIILNQLLPTMSMPISLYDDGSLMGASFGEMATKYNDVFGTFVNFAKGCVGRATDENGNVVVKPMYEVFNQKKCPFPVGFVTFNMDGVNPSTYDGWEDTSWEQVAQGRFIAGVGTGTDINGVTFDVSVGSDDDGVGEYQHTLSKSEMPSHTHNFTQKLDETSCDDDDNTHTVGSNNTTTSTTDSAGGDRPHNNIPPMFGLYAWERTA